MAFIAAASLAVILYVALTRPRAGKPISSPTLEALHEAVKSVGEPRPRPVIDLAAVDRNVDRVVAALGQHHRLRIVTKSIPSPSFIRYVATRARTHRLMEFHAPFLPELLATFPEADLDIMFGKPMPVLLASMVVASLSSTDRHRALKVTQWLVDSDEAVTEYLAWADRLHRADSDNPKPRLALEIDVGLHRGGFATPELAALAARRIEASGHAQVSGLMGYDGHVGYAPTVLGPRQKTVLREMKGLAQSYEAFTQAVVATGIAANRLTLNGGGSRTYMQYGSGVSAVQDIALGSAFLQPSDFDGPELKEHEPALFIAAPVIKIIDEPGVPFVGTTAGRLWAAYDPNMARGFFIYGGGWASHTAWPQGLHTHPLYDHAPNRNLLPNQDLYVGSKDYTIHRGDYLFFRPVESDLLFDFEEILAVRGAKVENRWKPFSRRF